MVSRPRLRSIVTALCLHLLAALAIGYFGVNAYSGNHGIEARKRLEREMTELTDQLAAAKAEREHWQRRVSLLKSDKLDPDLLDERARELLNYVDRRDVVLLEPAR
ncbi:hypothetical protein A33M_2269 [Rhodovulum sp. PH10]|uniref:FtsB family cell division protein n=1 Tax=Rhodovulum sp. PH10 TaxID=1187851 RepID=UPI00027C278B|nr:septum formation initiator family protein [Rhodovulum sp. PH10]EJW12146.1 hypothetical protein A33M_2269 [Rhodovulum sp. PH10]